MTLVMTVTRTHDESMQPLQRKGVDRRNEPVEEELDQLVDGLFAATGQLGPVEVTRVSDDARPAKTPVRPRT